MSEGRTSKTAPHGSPRDALEGAEDALLTLQQSQAREQKLGALTRFAVSAVVLLAWSGLIVHTFFEKESPRVDSTSVALLALALIAPFVSRLKALELGGAKAEWQEGASVSLAEIVQLLGMQQAAITQLFDEVAARAATGSETQGPITSPHEHADANVSRTGTLRRLLWVDDHPENNAYELESLRRILDVVTATTNEEAFAIVAEQQIDAVVSDIGRDYDPPGQRPGGVRLLQELHERFPDETPPILYYTSSRSIALYGAELEAGGAIVLATLFSDLLRGLRQLEGQLLEATVRVIADKRGRVQVKANANDVDVVVELENGQIIGIEAASWLQRPQMAPFADRVSRLTEAVQGGEITHGILLVRPEVLDDRRRQWAAEQGIRLVGAKDLEQVLDEFVTQQ